MLRFGRPEKGDTIIEVLFAVTVFSLVAVGGISIMNQGTAAAQRSLEITLVRQQIDAQAETLRFLNASYVSAYQSSTTFSIDTPAGQWQQIQEGIDGVTTASDFGTNDGTCPAIPDGSFVLNTNSAKFVKLVDDKYSPAVTYSQVRYDKDKDGASVVDKAEGIWIEGIKANIGGDNHQYSADYIDFHIRACWDSVGQSVPVTTGTIVRLYEPRG